MSTSPAVVAVAPWAMRKEDLEVSAVVAAAIPASLDPDRTARPQRAVEAVVVAG